MLAATITAIGVMIAGGYFLDTSFLNNIFKLYERSDNLDVKNDNLDVKNDNLYESNESPHEITVVTLYLNLGRFKKGTSGLHYTPDMYKSWMKTWGWLTNRVVGFFESDEDLRLFRQIRSGQPENMTVLLKVNRPDLPSFKNIDTIRRIFASPSYPKHPPNTVMAEYPCVMNAKYDALNMAITKGFVHTGYVAWLDIGLFRDLLDENHPPSYRFTLAVPENFNDSTVSMSEVGARHTLDKLSPWELIRDNVVWLGGAFFLGTKQSVLTFSESYAAMASELLKQNMSSTDQQVIGAMYSPAYIHQQKVGMRPYTCEKLPNYRRSNYFCLAYISKYAAEIQNQKTTTPTPAPK
jgi:hypothetical protein